MSTMALNWYEICVVNYKRADKHFNTFVSAGVSTQVVNDRYGLSFIPPQNKVKMDVRGKVPSHTIFRQARNYKHALNSAKRLGTVLFCHKVNTEFHFKKIEYLDLKQTPFKVSIEPQDEFILNAQGELTPSKQATRQALEEKYQIDIDIT